MDTLELNIEQVKILLGKAYEWRSKVNKRSNRLDHFKTQHAIDRFKKYAKENPEGKFQINKTEILLTITWFLRCLPHNDEEKNVFTLIGLIYKLHRSKLSNIKK